MMPAPFNIRKSVTQSHKEGLHARSGEVDFVKRFNIFGLTGIYDGVLSECMTLADIYLY